MTRYAALQFDPKLLVRRRQKLKGQGFILIKDALPTGYCEPIAGFIDTHLHEKNGEHESGHVGTTQRIWSAEKYSAIVQDCNDKCSRILSTLFGQPPKPQKILAMHNRVIGASMMNASRRSSTVGYTACPWWPSRARC